MKNENENKYACDRALLRRTILVLNKNIFEGDRRDG